MVMALVYVEKRRIAGNFGGKVECTEYLLAPFKTQAPRVVIPGMGDRIFSMTQDDEMVLSVPGSILTELVRVWKNPVKRSGRAIRSLSTRTSSQNSQGTSGAGQITGHFVGPHLLACRVGGVRSGCLRGLGAHRAELITLMRSVLMAPVGRGEGEVMQATIGDKTIELIKGTLRTGVDAVVNAANAQLILGAGVAERFAPKADPLFRRNATASAGLQWGRRWSPGREPQGALCRPCGRAAHG